MQNWFSALQAQMHSTCVSGTRLFRLQTLHSMNQGLALPHFKPKWFMQKDTI